MDPVQLMMMVMVMMKVSVGTDKLGENKERAASPRSDRNPPPPHPGAALIRSDLEMMKFLSSDDFALFFLSKLNLSVFYSHIKLKEHVIGVT